MRIRIECILAFSIFAGLLPSFAQKPPKLPKDLPAYGPLKPFVPPQIVEKTMPNGMTVWLVPRPGYPKVALALAIRGGLANDPETMPGLSELLASTVTLGTKVRTAKQIAQQIAAAGGDLSTHADKDDIVISTDVPSWKMQAGLSILADVAQNAEFPDEQVALAKRNAFDELRGQESRTGFLLFRAAEKVLFGNNPYSVFAPTQAAISKVDSSILRQAYAQRFHPERTILIAVGDFDAGQIMSTIDTAFGKWPASQEAALPSIPQPQRQVSRDIFIVDRPGSVQTTMALGSIGPTERDADYPAFEVANMLYGGMFSARLDSNIREDKGYTYGAGTEYQSWAGTALLLSAANVRNAVTGATLNEFQYELNRMATTTARPGELTSAQRHLIGAQALRMQSQEALASQFCSLWSVGLVPADLERENAEILKVTLDDVVMIGRKYFPASKQTIVMVGDRKAISEQVEPFGEELQPAP
jgi:predicted Zn-dependent peptidase